MGQSSAPQWLAVDAVLAAFGSPPAVARMRYQSFVVEAIGQGRGLWDDLVSQIYLGSDAWIERVRERVVIRPRADEHPRLQRVIGVPRMANVVATVARELSIDEERVRDGRGGVPRMLAAWIGCHEALLTNGEIAAGLRLRSSGYVSRLIQRCDRELARDASLRGCVDRCLSTIRRKQYEGKT
jgi:hypothetical protein